MAVERLKRSDNIVALSQELGVHRRLLYKWRDQLEPIEDGEGPQETTAVRRAVFSDGPSVVSGYFRLARKELPVDRSTLRDQAGRSAPSNFKLLSLRPCPRHKPGTRRPMPITRDSYPT